MRHRSFTLLMLLLAVTLTASSNPVDIGTAQTIGAKFVNANAKTPVRGDDLQLATTYSINRGDAAFYVFNTPNGFVIVAADDCATPILGYSDEGRPFDTENVPIQMQDYLNGFLEQIQYGIENRVQDETATRQWEQVRTTGKMKDLRGEKSLEEKIQELLKTRKFSTIEKGKEPTITKPALPQNRSNRAVEPLVTALWDQGCYYNAMCPEDPAGYCGGHVPTGCVATAMGMIMHYWGYPEQGIGSHSYTPGVYPEQTVNFGETTYDWANMPDQLDGNSTQAQIDAVSTLLWHCGVAVDMMYGANGSNASDLPVPEAFHSYFGYSSFGYCSGEYYRYKADNTMWLTEVKACLDLGRPLLYFASDTGGSGGHAFVCDGYNTDDLLHFNWGWGGNGNGYFAVDALNVEGFQFNGDIHALFGILPPIEFYLQYNIIEGGVEVTYEQPELGSSSYFSYPDTIVIPSQATIEGTNYPVIAVGDKAFQCCFSLRKVVIPNSVKTIGEYAFYSSGQLPSMEVVMSDSVTIIKRCAFTGAGIQSMDLPNTLLTIEPEAFSFTQITSITFPRSLTTIGHSWFFLSPIDTINWNADSCVMFWEGFIWENGASVINIGENVRYLPAILFASNACSSITLPESLISIGELCFAWNGNLSSITIPNNVRFIGASAFDGCGLSSVFFNAKCCHDAAYLFDNCTNLETISFGDSVKIIPSNMCVNVLCTSNLSTINFGSAIDTIEYYAFMGCENLTSISLPPSIRYVDYGAFSNCSGLAVVDMSSVYNPPTLGYDPFENNANDRKFLIPCESYDEYYNCDGWHHYEYNPYEDKYFIYDYRPFLKTVPETDIQFTGLPNDTLMGKVVIYKNASVCDSTTVYFAQAHFGYRFDHWDTGSTVNPDTLFLTHDTTIVAYFVKDQFNVTGVAGKHVFHSNFENPQQDTLWTLKNEDFVNRWYINPLEGTSRALFVSNDGGLNNCYSSVDAHSYVFAYVPFQLNEGDYVCAFDWRVEGNGYPNQDGLNIARGDCLFVFLYPGDVNDIPLVQDDWGGGCIGYDWDYHLSHSIYYTSLFNQHNWSRITQSLTVPESGDFNLLFYWRNGRNEIDGGEWEPNGHPAAIDNVVLGTIDTIRGYVIGAENVDYLDTATITAVPNPGYRFVCWYDCDTNPVKEVVVTGDLNCIAYFEPIPEEITQTTTFAPGWTWWSAFVELSGIDALTQLEQGLGANGQVIKSQTGYVSNGGTNGWNGSLVRVHNKSCYLVNALTATEVSLTAPAVNLAETPIVLSPGWTWIGFPVDHAMGLTEALSGLTPSEGDLIKSQQGYASYSALHGWTGSLTTLEPGKGYMYLSRNTGPVLLYYPVSRKE